MITNEMKAKIFALYLGAEIQNNIGKHMGKLVSACIDGTATINPLDRFEPRVCSMAVLQLILKPLSEITDSDAIEVARLLDPWLVEQMEYELTRARISDKGLIITIEGVQDKARKVRIFLPMGHVFCSDNENTINSGAIDFLRSKGYALPYMGIDLFESSLAIPKQ